MPGVSDEWGESHLLHKSTLGSEVTSQTLGEQGEALQGFSHDPPLILCTCLSLSGHFGCFPLALLYLGSLDLHGGAPSLALPTPQAWHVLLSRSLNLGLSL